MATYWADERGGRDMTGKSQIMQIEVFEVIIIITTEI